MGEIILVLIGILIALQINNANELEKLKRKEIQYLSNISKDSEKEIPIPTKEIDKMLNDLSQKNGFVMAAFEFNAL